MDTISLDNFKEEINQVREYFKHIQYVNEIVSYTSLKTDSSDVQLLLKTVQDHHKQFRTNRKIFEYKASIISLYGLLEKYVEIWIEEYLNSLSNLVSEYAQIDEKLKNNHFELSLKLIITITSRESAKYQHLTKETILEKLYKCISNSPEYNLNTEAFILFSGNLKHKQIVNLFELINISLNKSLKENQTLIQYIQQESQNISIANIKTDTLYNTINDLVERRNQIAHGSEILDILSISQLDPYLEFLEKYCQAIFETLAEDFIKQESIYVFQEIKNVVKVIANRILAFEIENYTIKVGDILIVRTGEGNFYKKHILTIELDNISHQELMIVGKTNIAISVDPKIKDSQSFYILKKPIIL
jgi:hypothetical protein